MNEKDIITHASAVLVDPNDAPLLTDEERERITDEAYAERLGVKPEQLGTVTLTVDDLRDLTKCFTDCDAALKPIAARLYSKVRGRKGMTEESIRQALVLVYGPLRALLTPTEPGEVLNAIMLAKAMTEGIEQLLARLLKEARRNGHA